MAVQQEIFGRVARIVEFPFKSGAGIDRENAHVYLDGLGRDRLYALAHGVPDENGVYTIATQRDKMGKVTQGFSRLALIQPRYVNDGMVLAFDGRDEIFVPDDYSQETVVPIRGATLNNGQTIYLASRMDRKVDEWMTDHVGAPLIAVKAGKAFERKVDQDYGEFPNPLRFQDGFTLHLHTRSSVTKVSEVARELSGNHSLEIDESSFRGNIILEASEFGQLAEAPHSEHSIATLRISDTIIVLPKPCGRCPVTRVVQSTGKVRGFATETALGHDKRWVNIYGNVVVIFGENGVPRNEGDIAVGQEVVIVDFRDPQLVIGGKEIKPHRA